MMRQLADQVEAGEVQTSAVLCIVSQPPGEWPAIFGWGDHQGDYGNIGLLEIAKQFIVASRTAR